MVNFLPPWQEDEKAPEFIRPLESHIINPMLITQGKTEYHAERAKNLATMPLVQQQHQEPLTISQGYHQVGMDMADPNVQKDPAWWQKAIAKLEPLKYIDIAPELLLEVGEGVIPGKWAGEGTAPRENFEAWKALFGEDQGSFKQRIDAAADAFEKRPLWMQIGVGIGAGLVTFGTGTVAKGLAMGGSNAGKLAAASVRGAGYLVDPAEMGVQAVSKSVKATNAFVRTVRDGKPYMERVTPQMMAVEGGSSDIEDFYSAARRNEIRTSFHLISNEQRLLDLFPYNSYENMNAPLFGYRGQEGARFKIDTTTNPGAPWGAADHPTKLPPILHRGNEFRRLFGDLSRSQRTSINDPVNAEILEEARDLAILVMQLGMASRPGAITGLTYRDLKNFLKTQTITVRGSNEYRQGTLYSLDELESLGAVENYITRLEEWAELNNFKLEDSTRAFTLENKKDGIDFFKAGASNTKNENKYRSTLKRIVDKYKPNYEITDDAKTIRNQRVSEEWLMGTPLEDLQMQLGHADIDHTLGYIHDIDLHIGTPQDAIQSVPLRQLMLGAGVLEQAAASGSTVLEDIGRNLSSLNIALNAAKIAGVVGRAKGKTVGGEIGNDLMARVGETYLRSDELRHINVDDWNLYNAQRDLGDVVDTSVLDLTEEVIRVSAIQEIVKNSRKGYNQIFAKFRGISSRSWKPKVAGKQRDITFWGKLQRAGYDLKGDKLVKPTDPRAIQDRADYAVETGLIRELGDGTTTQSAAQWDAWALGLAEERKTLRNILDDYGHLKYVKDDGTVGGKSRHLLHEVLDQYVLGKMYHIKQQWNNLVRDGLVDSNSDHFAKLIDYIIDGNASANIVNASGSDGAYWKGLNEAKKALKHSDILDPYTWRNLGPQQFKDVGNNIRISTKPIIYRGRKIVMAIMPDGTRQPFYFRTGRGGPLAEGKGREWRPFDGIAPIISENGWMDKAVYALGEADDPASEWYRYGVNNHTIREVARHLDSISDQIPDGPVANNLEQVNEFLQVKYNSSRQGDWQDGKNMAWEDVSPHAEEITGARGYLEADYKQKNHHIRMWLRDPNVREALKMYRFSRDSSPEKIREKLGSLAVNTPDMFGPGFTKLAKNKGEAERFLDDITQRMVLHREEWLEEYAHANVRALVGKDAETEVFTQLRKPLGDAKDIREYHGISVESAVKSPDLENHVPRIRSVEWMKRLAAKDSGVLGFFNKNLFQTAVSALSGGKAMFGRSIIKPIAARAYLYSRHERDAIHLGVLAKAVMEDTQDGLGMKTIDATEEMQRLGIMKGNQYFSALELRPLEEIRKFESLQSTQNIYAQIGRLANKASKEGFKPALKKITRVTGLHERGYDEAAQIGDDLSNPSNMLRQVDVVLERILPEHWEHYFSNLKTADGQYTQQWHALRYIKELQNQVDQVAKSRGLDIVASIRANEGTYLANYFPRLYRRGDQRYRLGAPQREIGNISRNNFVSQFQPRQLPDILDQLGKSLNTVSKTSDELIASVLESTDDRLAMYYESIMKEATDLQTKKHILDMDYSKNYAKGVKEFKQKDDELDNLSNLLNAKLTGMVTGDAKWTARADKLLRSNYIKHYNWLVDDNPASVERARAAQDEIFNYIDQERMQLGYEKELVEGQRVISDDWMRAVWKKLPPAEQQAAREQLELTAPALVKPITELGKQAYPITNILRTFKAGIDVGAPMIHGFNALVRLPMLDGKFDLASQKAWWTGVKQMYRFLWNPDNLDTYIVDNYALRQEASEWIKLGSAEPLSAALGESAFMQRFKKNASKAWIKSPLPGVQGKPDFRLLDRFESGFVGYTDVLRLELYKAFKPSVDRQLRRDYPKIKLDDTADPIVRNAYHEMGATINKMTGVFDQELAAQSPMQRILESSLLFFAPMYRRAVYGIIADIFRSSEGGWTAVPGQSLRSREALKQLTGVVGVGAMIASLVDMTGNNPEGAGDIENFIMHGDDPNLTHKFGKMNISGVHTGIGTAWWTAFRLASDLAMIGYGEDKPLDDENNNWMKDNAVLRLLQRKGRSQLAPGAGLLTDFVLGKSFSGDPLRDPDGLWGYDWSESVFHVGKAAFPFWLDGAASGSWGDGSAPLMMTSEALGFTSYKMSAYDRLSQARQYHLATSQIEEIKTWREEVEKENGEVNWLNASGPVKRIIDDELPDVAILKMEAEKRAAVFAEGQSGEYRDFLSRKAYQTQLTMRDVSTFTMQWEKNEIDGRTLGMQIAKVKYNRAKSNEALLASYPALENYLNDLKAGKSNKDKLFWGKIFYDAYQAQVAHHPSNINDDGTFNFQNRENLHLQFLEDHNIDNDGKEMAYIREEQNAWMDANPVLKSYIEDREALKPYWQAHKLIWKPGTRGHMLASYYVSLSTSNRKALRDARPEFAAIDKKIRATRKRLREQSPYYDWLLVKWGYVSAPTHGNVQRLKEQQDAKKKYARMQELTNPDSWPYESPKRDRIFVNISGRIEIRKGVTDSEVVRTTEGERVSFLSEEDQALLTPGL